MTATTHKQFSIGWAALGAIILYSSGMTEINYYLALIIILQMAKFGAIFPDIDHAWVNVKDKTIVTWIINKLIHITGGSHRSWQTHSIDIAVMFSLISYYLPSKLEEIGKLSHVNKEVLSIIMLAFSLGWLSHIFSDMLTSGQVKLICFLKYKISIVPNHIFKFKFNTGEEWEQFVYTIATIINIPINIIALVYPLLSEKHIEKILARLFY